MDKNYLKYQTVKYSCNFPIEMHTNQTTRTILLFSYPHFLLRNFCLFYRLMKFQSNLILKPMFCEIRILSNDFQELFYQFKFSDIFKSFKISKRLFEKNWSFKKLLKRSPESFRKALKKAVKKLLKKRFKSFLKSF